MRVEFDKQFIYYYLCDNVHSTETFCDLYI